METPILCLGTILHQTQCRAENKEIMRKGVVRKMNVTMISSKKVTTRRSFKGDELCLRTKLK